MLFCAISTLRTTAAVNIASSSLVGQTRCVSYSVVTVLPWDGLYFIDLIIDTFICLHGSRMWLRSDFIPPESPARSPRYRISTKVDLCLYYAKQLSFWEQNSCSQVNYLLELESVEVPLLRNPHSCRCVPVISFFWIATKGHDLWRGSACPSTGNSNASASPSVRPGLAWGLRCRGWNYKPTLLNSDPLWGVTNKWATKKLTK